MSGPAEQAIKELRAWAYDSPHGTAAHEVLNILRSWRLDPHIEDPPAERQFDSVLFWGNDVHSIEDAKKLEAIFHHVLYDMLGMLQQPPHSSSDEEAKAAEKWTKEERQRYNTHIRDIVMALTGQELPPQWLDWEKKLVIQFFNEGGKLIKEFSDPTVIKIGRRVAADVTLDDDSVEDFHTYAVVGNGRVFIPDLGSKTGTKINNQEGGEHELTDGCILTVGNVNLKIRILEME
jgi:hypothetical protein